MTHNSYTKKAKVLSMGYPLHVNFGDPKDNRLSVSLKPTSRDQRPTKLHQGPEVQAIVEQAGELLVTQK